MVIHKTAVDTTLATVHMTLQPYRYDHQSLPFSFFVEGVLVTLLWGAAYNSIVGDWGGNDNILSVKSQVITNIFDQTSVGPYTEPSWFVL